MLDNFTNEKLQAELEMPQQLTEIDTRPLREICQKYINEKAANGCADDINDIEYYIFETTLEAIFGKGVWEWVNSHTR